MVIILTQNFFRDFNMVDVSKYLDMVDPIFEFFGKFEEVIVLVYVRGVLAYTSSWWQQNVQAVCSTSFFLERVGNCQSNL